SIRVSGPTEDWPNAIFWRRGRLAVQDNEPWQRLLREALAVLALPPDEQVRVNHPGCVACELLNDFDHARLVTVENAGAALSDEQRWFLDAIDAAMQEMEDSDFECFNNEVVRRPAWQVLRELAAEALKAFGWEGTAVRPFEKVEPGVWRRPASDPWQIQG